MNIVVLSIGLALILVSVFAMLGAIESSANNGRHSITLTFAVVSLGCAWVGGALIGAL